MGKTDWIMRNVLLRVTVAALLGLSVTGCGLLRGIFHKGKPEVEAVAGTVQNMYQVRHEYDARQLDSMCVADNLPPKLWEWTFRSYIDYETGNVVDRYMFIKELNDNGEMVYIVTPKGDVFAVSKRKVVTEEE